MLSTPYLTGFWKFPPKPCQSPVKTEGRFPREAKEGVGDGGGATRALGRGEI